jgi:hypothetical protein
MDRKIYSTMETPGSQGDSLDVMGARRHDGLACCDGAGEAHLAHLRRVDQLDADLRRETRPTRSDGTLIWVQLRMAGGRGRIYGVPWGGRARVCAS